MVFDESSFDITRVPGVKVVAQLSGSLPLVRRQVAHVPGRRGGRAELVHRIQRAELGCRCAPIGRFADFVTRIAAGRVERGLPHVAEALRLQDLQPLSDVGRVRRRAVLPEDHAASSTSSTRGTSAPRGLEPDAFYYDNAVKVMTRERGRQAAVHVRLHGGQPLPVDLSLPRRADAGLEADRQSRRRWTNICAARA